MKTIEWFATIMRTLALGVAFAFPAYSQEILPFPSTPSASTAGLTMQDSIYHKRVDPKHLPADAVNGQAVAQDRVPITATLGFTANDCLNFGSDLGSPVSLDYFDQKPFKFSGTIKEARVEYTK